MNTRIGPTLPLLLLLSVAACATPEMGPLPHGIVASRHDSRASDDDSPAPAGVVLVRTADLSVTVDAYDAPREALGTWLAAEGGVVADEQVWRSDGQAHHASLRLRVPADRLDALLAWMDEQVEVDSVDVRAADRTAEWVDLEARIRAHQAAEERLLGLIADRAASLGDVLAAEAELTRIRSEIEALRGRYRTLADQVALATVQLSVRVRTPLGEAWREPLTTQAGRAFWGSLAAMGWLGRAAVVGLAGATPWLGVLAVLCGAGAAGTSAAGGVGLVLLRRRRVA